jgi:hypothetical protein
MDAHPAANRPNRYCQRLGLPTPNLDVALGRSDVRVIHLMALAVLEAGGPLSIDAIAARLKQLALPPRLAAAANPASLRKAWHGQAPLVGDPHDGRFYLDLLADHEVHWISYLADPRRLPSAPPQPQEYRSAADDEPLSQEEVDAALNDRTLYTYSTIRKAAAILEASGGGPLSLEEVNQRLALHGAYAGQIDERAVGLWKSDLVAIEPDGRLRLNRTSLNVPGFRRDIRRMAASRLRQRADHATFRAQQAEHEKRRADEERRAIDEARRIRRAVVHIVAVNSAPRAAAVIDAAARSSRLFIGDALSGLAGYLEEFEFLAGVDLRSSLRLLGLDPDRWWLAELRPTQRTFRPSEREAVKVSLSAVVQATTGKGRVPGDTSVWESLLAARSTTRLAARLEQDAQALFALYEYGALHGGVRVRSRAGDSLLPVGWSMRGDAHVGDMVDAATRQWLPVQVVVGRAAELADPWPLARTVTIVERDRRALYIREDDEVRPLDPADIRAIRLPPGAAAPTVSRLSWLHVDRRICRMTVTLDGIQPPIWRTLEVPARVTMAKLHQLLQAALGWTDSHLHVFEIGAQRIAVPYHLEQLTDGQITRSGRLVRLADVIDHGVRRFDYEYDFGDSWHHSIAIDEVRDERDGDGGACCLGGARACPPEDCGGADGYARLLDILFDPRHPEFEEMRRWAGAFEPERFDLKRVNAALAAVPAY